MKKTFREYLPESFFAKESYILTELTDGPSDSISPVNGNNAATSPDLSNSTHGVRELNRGDVVKVIGKVNYKDKRGTITDFSTRNGEDNKSFVVIDFGEAKDEDGNKIGTKSFHISNVEYDDYGQEDDDVESEDQYEHSLANLRKMAGY